MEFWTKIDHVHLTVKENRWHKYFYVFCRVSLAIGFFIAGMVKIMGERFASGLSAVHPMGSYLEALHHTGYYYTFIGVSQVFAALLILYHRTVLMGALLYFSIIVNIWILSWAVRFDGSLMSSTLMVLANLYLICWNYDRLKYLFLPPKTTVLDLKKKQNKNKFPLKFFSGVLLAIVLVFVITFNIFDVRPRNTIEQCKRQFENTAFEDEGFEFCECVHSKGHPLNSCLDAFEVAFK
mgnify:CR=1 FL=1